MTTIKKLIGDAVDAELAATTLGIDQLKAAALAATSDEWRLDKSNGLKWKGIADKNFNEAANPATILALLERLQVAEDAAKDAERLDFIAAHPEMQLRCHKKRWSFIGFTNYEFDTFLNPREAIDAAIAALQGEKA
jgi:hypothetical protein